VGQIVGNLGDRGTLDPALPRTLEPEQILGSVGSKQDFEAVKSMPFLGLSADPLASPDSKLWVPGFLPIPDPGPSSKSWYLLASNDEFGRADPGTPESCQMVPF